VKTILAGLFALAGMAAVAFAVMEVPQALPVAPPTLGVVAVRAFPKGAGLVAAPTPTAAPTPDEDPEPMKRIEPRDAGVKAAAAEVDAGAKAVPVVANQAKADAGVKAAPAAPVGDGTLNLQASDTADVYVDGRKVGASPVMGLKVKAGTHKVRFDCYDEAGNAVTGTVKPITLNTDEEQEVTWTCAAAQ
jgi:hypothetical protein